MDRIITEKKKVRRFIQEIHVKPELTGKIIDALSLDYELDINEITEKDRVVEIKIIIYEVLER